MNRFLLLIVLAIVPTWVFGQTTDQASPPKDPILPRTDVQAQWTILYCYEREKALAELTQKGAVQPSLAIGKEKIASSRPVALEVSKDNVTYGEKTTWSDGHDSEKWVKDGLQLWGIPSNGVIVRVLLRYSSPQFSDYTHSDFEKLEWIGKDVYVGTKKLGQRTVYVFSVPAAKKRPSARELYNRTAFGATHEPEDKILTAYLDAQTQLPVAFDDGIVIYFYTFAPAPGLLTVPEKFSQEFDAWKLELQQNQHHSGQS